MSNTYYDRNNFLMTKVNRSLLLVNVILTLMYFGAIAFLFPVSSRVMYWLLMATQLFYMLQAFGFWYTIWDTEYEAPRQFTNQPGVDVFITVLGEPVEIVAATAMAAQRMDYPDFKVYLLNDSYVGGKPNWREYELLAERLGIECITREKPGGAKAGNINNALRQTSNPFFVVFDCDHVPHKDFLFKMMSYVVDEKVAFVQAPQFYANSDANFITGGAWEQQELFFGALMKGKNRMNAAFMCGTNMLIRREAVMQVGGMCETNIAEDFLTSLFVHAKGWTSVYVSEILSEGLAPEDFLSYTKQQFRWARGSLEVVFKFNPLFMRGLTWKQRLQYLASASYYLSGAVVLLNAVFPLIYFATGATPFNISTMVLAAVFLPYIFLTLYTISLATNFSYTYRAIAFSMSSFMIHIKAMFSVIFNIKQGFSVTSKQALNGNYLNLASAHIAYVALAVGGAGYAIAREGITASVMSNISWAIIYSVVFATFIVAAMPESAALAEAEERERLSQQRQITGSAGTGASRTR